jgi:hypothetical protein
MPAPEPRLRVTLASVPDEYRLPGRPSSGPTSAVDCHRQTTFILGSELALFERIINAHIEAARALKSVDSSRAAAAITYQSRTLSLLRGCCALLLTGSYDSCLPLLRSAVDSLAVQISLQDDAFADYDAWFENAVTKDGTSTAIGLGMYRAGGAISADPTLDSTYRFVSDLSMPHFGSTLWLSAPAIDPLKAPLSYLPGAFHLAWAELITGFLLALAAAQARASNIPAAKELSDQVNTISAGQRRAHIEEQDNRWLINNFRRDNRGQPRTVILA